MRFRNQNSDLRPDACRKDCAAPKCGDEVVDSEEECDDGPQNDDLVVGACRTTCRYGACGDGILDPGEECDDGGDPTSDCNSACLITTGLGKANASTCQCNHVHIDHTYSDWFTVVGLLIALSLRRRRRP